MPAVRVVTANLLHGIDVERRRVDLERAAGALGDLGADVIAVQEVDRGLARTGRVDQIAELARLLAMHGAFAPALAGDPDRSWHPIPGADTGEPGYGIGLLSRHPLGSIERLPLPGGDRASRRPGAAGGTGQGVGGDAPPSPGWDREPRVALSASVGIAGRPLRVTTTHLSYLPWRGARQLRRALHAARAHGGAAVLAGDLNLPLWVVRALAPGWAHAGGTPTYPAWRPRLQPDQLLHGRALALTDVRAAPVASDHLALVADLRLER